MEKSVDQKNAFDQFCRGERQLFCIGEATAANNLDSLTFRKMPNNKRQIVAWSRCEAERWRIENKLEASKVVSLTFTELRSHLMSMPEELREFYALEVV